MKRTFPLAALVVLLMAAPAAAQPDADRRAERKELHQATRAYVRENITPVMRPLRQSLESELTADDQALLQDLRTQLRALKQEGQQLREAHRANREQGQRPTDEQRTQFRQMRNQHRALVGQAAALANKYDGPISARLDQVEGQQEQWRTDLKAIREQYAPERKHEASPARGPRRGHGDRDPVKFLTPEGFLLWNPSGRADEEPVELEGSRLFPNPTDGPATVAYEVQTPGRVVVEVLNREGRVVRTLVDEPQQVGRYERSVVLDDSPSDYYLYRVTTPAGTETKPFVVR
ncbi:MAG: T9SS type A sorting domain-containing protein [Catalinimonas sp.]